MREDIRILYLLLILGSMIPPAFTIVVKGLLCSPMLVAAANNPFGNMGSIVHGLVLHSIAMYFFLILPPLSLALYRAASFETPLRRMLASDVLYIYLPLLIPTLIIIAYYEFVAARMPPGAFAERFLDMVGLAEITYLLLTVYVPVLGVPLAITRAAGMKVELDVGVKELVFCGTIAIIAARITGYLASLLVNAAIHGALLTCSAAGLGIHSLNPNLPKLEDTLTVSPGEAVGTFLLSLVYFYLVTWLLGEE